MCVLAKTLLHLFSSVVWYNYYYYYYFIIIIIIIMAFQYRNNRYKGDVIVHTSKIELFFSFVM